MTLNRIFFIPFVVAAAIWIYATIDDWIKDADDRAFYTNQVVPYLNAQAREINGLQQALNTPKNGAITPLPTTPPSTTNPLDEMALRMERRVNAGWLRFYSGITCMVIFGGWTIARLIQRECFERKRQAPDRPADSDAGSKIAQLNSEGGILIAKSTDTRFRITRAGTEICIDARKGTAVFHGFNFVTAFIGNRPSDRTELPLTDILGARLDVSHGHASLRLRTARGRLVIGDNLQPFQPLAAILFDVVEQNRASPETYRVALAREPVVRTPWYGWLIIATALGLVAWIIVLVVQH